MFKHIVVPVDFTPKNLEAIEIATEMAKASRGRIVLLHVIETIKHIPFEDMEDFYSRLEKSALEKSAKLISDYASQDVQIDQKVLFGRRAQVIVDFARESRVDLIILNSHPVDPEEGAAGFSTISYKVGVFAHCPVLLIK